MPLTKDEEIELASLQPKLRAREGQLGYSQNVSDIKARIADLERKKGTA